MYMLHKRLYASVYNLDKFNNIDNVTGKKTHKLI